MWSKSIGGTGFLSLASEVADDLCWQCGGDDPSDRSLGKNRIFLCPDHLGNCWNIYFLFSAKWHDKNCCCHQNVQRKFFCFLPVAVDSRDGKSRLLESISNDFYWEKIIRYSGHGRFFEVLAYLKYPWYVSWKYPVSFGCLWIISCLLNIYSLCRIFRIPIKCVVSFGYP